MPGKLFDIVPMARGLAACLRMIRDEKSKIKSYQEAMFCLATVGSEGTVQLYTIGLSLPRLILLPRCSPSRPWTLGHFQIVIGPVRSP